MENVANTAAHTDQKQYQLPLAILTSLFFMWGFITCLNDILIPHLKAVFELSYFQAMTVNTAFFGAYAIVSYPAGAYVKKVGYQRGIVTGLTIAGVGCLMFYPAASTQVFGLFLLSLFVLAAGITVLQVSANPYVTRLGPVRTASSRLTLTQAFNSLGTTLAPFFGAAFIFSVATVASAELATMSAESVEAYKASQAASVQLPYIILATALFVLAIIFSRLNLPVIEEEQHDPELAKGGFKAALKHSHLLFGVIGIFVYVGGEVTIGSLLVNFFAEPSIAGLAEKEASALVSYYWGGAMVGRFVGAAVMTKVSPRAVLTFNALAVVVLVLTAMNTSGSTAMWAILAVGLFNSIMFPTIFSLAIERLGPLASVGSGLLCVAIFGGAVIPPIQGLIADLHGIQFSFILPVLCYIYIAWYGFSGSKLKD
ncbi:L-fucose:H+ symporter permease [Neptunicella marina]|uniref:L-fucose:H+ symporter permease n=1 Tax=Neptunicella marina TaxID=2125989 RepID=A0A8J6J0Y8_9ALTE|nr:L-fucose:H+ symporter permease [Neptunicella marina]MBC3767702.1 L-fucose:H+ symporter permease [Neptunicella marina]